MVLLETDRLKIRAFVPGDVGAYAAICADPSVMRFIGHGSVLTRRQAADQVDRFVKRHGLGLYTRYAVCLKQDGAFVGFCGFGDFLGNIDFGWRYAREVWGQGYATEAAQSVLALGKKELGLGRVVAVAARENLASIRIMEKIGMVFWEQDSWEGIPVVKYRA